MDRPPPRDSCTSFQFNLENFRDLRTTKGHYVETPEFLCNGHKWNLMIFPGGEAETTEGDDDYVSIYLYHHTGGFIEASYELSIIDKFGKTKKAFRSKNCVFGLSLHQWGWPNFIRRFDTLDESQNILDSDGALKIVVSIEVEDKPMGVYVPKNPFLNMIRDKLFLDADTADVCFEVIDSADAKTLVSFHAHSQILQVCAPMLANLFDLDRRDLQLATITDAKSDIFYYLLYYVYGGSVPEEDLATHAKDIIDAADKYSIVNLKLEAEAAYVKSTEITMQSAMDDLLYADAKNCPLLKEAVMNFLAENSAEAHEKMSFTDFPGHVVKDLLLAVSNTKKEASETTSDELASLSVSDLRRKLAAKGLDVDGSREAMIESLRNANSYLNFGFH